MEAFISIGFLSSTSEELLIPLLLNKDSHMMKVNLLLFHRTDNLNFNEEITNNPRYSLPLPFFSKVGKPAYYNIYKHTQTEFIESIEKWITKVTAFFRLNKKHNLVQKITSNGGEFLEILKANNFIPENASNNYGSLIASLYNSLGISDRISVLNIEKKSDQLVINNQSIDSYKIVLSIASIILDSIEIGETELNKFNQKNFKLKINEQWENVIRLSKVDDNTLLIHTKKRILNFIKKDNKLSLINKEFISVGVDLKGGFTNLYLSHFGIIGHIPWYLYDRSIKKDVLKFPAYEFIKPFWPQNYIEATTNKLDHANLSIISSLVNPLIRDFLSIYLGDLNESDIELLSFLLNSISGRSRSKNKQFKLTRLLSNIFYQKISEQTISNKRKFLQNQSHEFVQLAELVCMLRLYRKSIFMNNRINFESLLHPLHQYVVFSENNILEDICIISRDVLNSFKTFIMNKHASLSFEVENLIRELTKIMDEISKHSDNYNPHLLFYSLEKLIDSFVRNIIISLAEIFNTVINPNIWILYLLLGKETKNIFNDTLRKRQYSFSKTDLLIRN